MTTINQKEYLKKYLSIGKAPGDKKKKKKRIKRAISDRVKIIDDDADGFAQPTPPEDLLAQNEDAPQIVAIIDERPPSLRVDDKTKNHMWQPIGVISDDDEVPPNVKVENRSDSKRQKDNSPPRQRIKIEDSSPPRHRIKSEDSSPPRRRSTKTSTDQSPPRRKRHDSPGTSTKTSDSSPPRKSKRSDTSPSRRTKTSDISPPRKPRTNDSSPSRKRRSSDSSPPRKSKTSDASPSRRKRRDDTPPKPRSRSKASRWRDDTPPRKMEKTLDGKAAGLQDAKQLTQETARFKAREDQLFKAMSSETSGRDAQTVLRDRKTGRVRNVEEEYEKQRQKEEEEQKTKEKYDRWGKGLAQVESREQKIRDEIHEMSKPLARYADDVDLERHLKEQEREGDPMLQYLRSKRKKEAVERGEQFTPEFEGQFMPNRYGIRPGHRWDGVDRSNGYEKKWFEVQNAKRAQQEENYKWSTEDM